MNNKKKIAVLCDYKLMPERIGGMDRFFWLFDEKCKNLGYDIVWFFPNNDIHGNYLNFTIIHSAKSVEKTFLEYNQKFDFIFTHFIELCTPFFKEVKKKYSNSKIIAVDHNSRPINGYAFKKKMNKKIKGFFYSKFIDVFVGVSEYTNSQIIKDFGKIPKEKLLRIYNGINTELYKCKVIENTIKPKFLVAAHLVYTKGVQDLIIAVSLLPKEIQKDLTIDIYGKGVFKEELVEMVSVLKLDTVFTFMGSVPNLFEIYANYDYLILPTHMECFNLSILESLSANVPVITTPVGGNSEIVKDNINGFLTSVQNPKELSAILEKLMVGSIGIKKDVSKIIERDFSINRMVQDYINIIYVI